jgi:methylamine dehydrogenase accessory protein MauD
MWKRLMRRPPRRRSLAANDEHPAYFSPNQALHGDRAVSGLLLGARLVLAAVFVAAAGGKLLDLDGSRRAAERFGVPTRLARPVGTALPLLELALAAALVTVAAAPLAAIAAAGLLLVFSTVVARSLARGESHECNCFGALHSSRIGLPTLARNLLLAALAVFVATVGRHGGGASATAWIGALGPAGAALLVLGLVIATQSAFSWQLFKQNARLLERLDRLEAGTGAEVSNTELQVGQLAPRFALPDLDGRAFDVDELLAADRGAVLVFADPGCGHCGALLPLIGEAQAAEAGPPLVVISRGDPADNRARAEEHGITALVLQDDNEVAEAYGVTRVPAAVVLDQYGLLAREPATGSQAVSKLLEDLHPTVRAKVAVV